MATGDTYLNATNRRLLGTEDFSDRLIGYMQKLSKDTTANIFGQQGAFSTIGMSGFGANRFQVDDDFIATDGLGHFFQTDVVLSGRDVGVAFENTNAAIYSVAYAYMEVPSGLQINPRTMQPEFTGLAESIGQRDDPTSVTDNGDGTITFNVNSVCDPFSTTVRTHAGRKVVVWKKAIGSGATSESLSKEICIVSFSAGNNTITTTLPGVSGAGTFGQSSVSTTASDYQVALLGPTVTLQSETDLVSEAGYFYVGTITGNAGTPVTFSAAGQLSLVAGFGDLTAVTETVNSDLKIRVGAVADDLLSGGDTPQISVENFPAATKVFTVDEDGDTVLNDLTVAGNATVAGTLGLTGALTGATFGFTGNCTVGGTLGVTGVASLLNNATVGGTLGITGATSGTTFGFTGNCTVGGTLGITGALAAASGAFVGAITGAAVGSSGSYWGSAFIDDVTLDTLTFKSVKIGHISTDRNGWERQLQPEVNSFVSWDTNLATGLPVTLLSQPTGVVGTYFFIATLSGRVLRAATLKKILLNFTLNGTLGETVWDVEVFRSKRDGSGLIESLQTGGPASMGAVGAGAQSLTVTLDKNNAISASNYLDYTYYISVVAERVSGSTLVNCRVASAIWEYDYTEFRS